MKKLLFEIFLICFILLTVLNLIFFIEILRNHDIKEFFFNKTPLDEKYLDIERVHMQETKDLYYFSLFLNLISLIGVFIFKSKINYKTIGLSLMITSVVLFLLALNFDIFFTNFHKVLFKSNNWLLPADSMLIKTYPLSFFSSRFLLFELLVFFVGLCFLVLRIYRAHKRIALKNILNNK